MQYSTCRNRIMFADIPAFQLLILLVLYVCIECFRPALVKLSPTTGKSSRLFFSVSNSLSDAEKMKQAVGYKVFVFEIRVYTLFVHICAVSEKYGYINDLTVCIYSCLRCISDYSFVYLPLLRP